MFFYKEKCVLKLFISNVIVKNYKQFRDELQHAYPVSKWKIKLPIATKLIDLPDLKLNDNIQ